MTARLASLGETMKAILIGLIFGLLLAAEIIKEFEDR